MLKNVVYPDADGWFGAGIVSSYCRFLACWSGFPCNSEKVMRPRKSASEDPQGALFKTELRYLVDERHPLVKLAGEVDWRQFEASFGSPYSDAGRPGIPTRLMVALHYLKYTFDLSDEAVVQGWVENPYWQFFSGEKFFQFDVPIDPSSMTRWRKRVGEAGAEELLRETIQAGLRLNLIKPAQLQRVNVDTTVQEKNVRFPTDARLLDRARERLVKQAQAEGVQLRQSYARVGKQTLLMQSRYAHAKQFKRARKATRKLRTILGRVIRDVERKATDPSRELQELLVVSKRILEQERASKNKVCQTCTNRWWSASVRARRTSVTSSVARSPSPLPVGAGGCWRRRRITATRTTGTPYPPRWSSSRGSLVASRSTCSWTWVTADTVTTAPLPCTSTSAGAAGSPRASGSG